MARKVCQEQTYFYRSEHEVKLKVLPKGIYLNLSFQIVQEVVQTKKSTVDIEKMAGTSVPVHFSYVFVLGIPLT